MRREGPLVRNYLQIAIRSLLRHKVYSLINVLGLASGLDGDGRVVKGLRLPDQPERMVFCFKHIRRSCDRAIHRELPGAQSGPIQSGGSAAA